MTATAPGRVNLMGDHTDYVGGLAMPMAIDLATTVTGERHQSATNAVVRLRSADDPHDAIIDVADPLSAKGPDWARYVAGVVATVDPPGGFTGTVTTTVPIGGGLSSSAALEVALALALGFSGTPLELALACQKAEQLSAGVPCGIMDQLASAAGQAGHALLMDFQTLEARPVPIPDEAEIVVIGSGAQRTLAGSEYAARRTGCEEIERIIGPLRDAGLSDLNMLSGTARRRARHVVTENQRVLDFAEMLLAGDLEAAGELMVASHRSLADDYSVSTGALDQLVDRLVATDGVYGARLTGAGFGGCVVALSRPGTLDEGWTVQASDGARLVSPSGTERRSKDQTPRS